MTLPSRDPSLRELFELFNDPQPIEPPQFGYVSADELPPAFRRLLAHENHMTLALEEFHGRPVKLHVLSVANRGDEYARMILLSLDGTERIVEFGIVLLDFGLLTRDVRAEIVAGTTPLGRILIEHDVLRRISPTHFLKITPNAALMNWFGLTTPEPVYGRLATIMCDGVPAIDLLEIVRL